MPYSQKRQAPDSVLPLHRPNKHRRLSAKRYDGQNASPSQTEGLGARWVAISADILKLFGDTVRHLIQGESLHDSLPKPATMADTYQKAQRIPLPPSPRTTPPSSPLNTPPVSIALADKLASHPPVGSLTSTLTFPSTDASASTSSSESRVVRRYITRDHIYQKEHKERVKADLWADHEAMSKEWYRIRVQSEGFRSNYSEFQSWASYREYLNNIAKKDILSLSPSLTNVRTKRLDSTSSSRRYSVSGTPSTSFLENALLKAKQTLNEPRPRPFSPTYEQLRARNRKKDEAIEKRLRPKITVPSSLPPEHEAQVNTLLMKKGVIAKYAREQVGSDDLVRLRPGKWLNDEIINFYGAMLLGRSNDQKENPGKYLNIHYFSTFFWSKLKGEGYQKGRLAKWTKTFDLFAKDAVLIPINHSNAHWTAAVINFRQKRIESYDSMGDPHPAIFKKLRDYLDLEHQTKKKKPFNFEGWEDYTCPDTPQQENGYDCGVFTCNFLETASRGEETFAFTQQDMTYLRRRMIWEIGNSRLRDDWT